MTIKQGIIYSNGFSEYICVTVFSLIMCFVSFVCNILLLSLFFVIVFLCFLGILYYKYYKIKNIVNNQVILHTKIIECKSTYDSGEFVFKLEKGSIYLLSSYFDDISGQSYMFETFCISKPFRNVKRQRINYGENVLLPIESIDVCVNKKNFNEYFFILDSFKLKEDN